MKTICMGMIVRFELRIHHNEHEFGECRKKSIIERGTLIQIDINCQRRTKHFSGRHDKWEANYLSYCSSNRPENHQNSELDVFRAKTVLSHVKMLPASIKMRQKQICIRRRKKKTSRRCITLISLNELLLLTEIKSNVQQRGANIEWECKLD